MWSLTPQAMSLFPDTHAQLTVDLIGTIRSEFGEAAFCRLLRRRTEGIAANYRRTLAREPGIAGKLAALVDIRTAEGPPPKRVTALHCGGVLKTMLLSGRLEPVECLRLWPRKRDSSEIEQNP